MPKFLVIPHTAAQEQLQAWRATAEARLALDAAGKLMEHACESDTILASLGDAHQVLSEAEFSAYSKMVRLVASVVDYD